MTAVRQFGRGVGVSAINPKELLLLLALLPQFTSPNGWPAWAQMLNLGSLQHAAQLRSRLLHRGAAGPAHPALAARASVVVTKLAGIVMTVIGAGILRGSHHHEPRRQPRQLTKGMIAPATGAAARYSWRYGAYLASLACAPSAPITAV